MNFPLLNDNGKKINKKLTKHETSKKRREKD